ncbi:hypothetical protein Hanom_Chr07g00615501 [Helianthus anomalus]
MPPKTISKISSFSSLLSSRIYNAYDTRKGKQPHHHASHHNVYKTRCFRLTLFGYNPF